MFTLQKTPHKKIKKSQTTHWEKIFANRTSDERLVSGMHKELLQLNKRAGIKNKWAKM